MKNPAAGPQGIYILICHSCGSRNPGRQKTGFRIFRKERRV